MPWMSPGKYTPSTKYAVPDSTPNCTPASTFDWPRITGRSVVRPKACENDRPGVYCAMSSIVARPCSSIVLAVKADTATGASRSVSSVLRAVTMISSSACAEALVDTCPSAAATASPRSTERE